jgi:lysophospholipase L1-like esterase
MFPFKKISVAAIVVAAASVASAIDGGIAVKDGDAIAFLGDSITSQGNKPAGYVNLVMKGLEVAGVKGAKKIPAGVSGHKSNQMLERVERDCLSKKPAFMTVSCGVNDVWHGARGVPLEDYKKNMCGIFDKAAAANVAVVVLTPTMIGEEADNAGNAKLKGYVDWLVAEAKRRGLRMADLNADMHRTLDEMRAKAKAKGERLPSKLLTVDGVHMAFPGNCMMAWGVLRALGVPDILKADIEVAWRKIPEAYNIQAKFTAEEYDAVKAKVGGGDPEAFVRRLALGDRAPAEAPGECALIPMPKKVVWKDGWHSAAAGPDDVQVKRLADAGIPEEGYRLKVAADGITVWSSGEAGAFYARQTLRQLGVWDGKAWKYRCVEIDDAPAYRWRGALLDEGRHFFGKETVRRMLDLMAMYKYNVFHWHLTEDQGWRLDVPAYPKLAECGSMRRRSPAHGATLKRSTKDGRREYHSTKMTTERYGPFFYTAEDVKEILAYAKERHITVVPEIEMPGHARAAIGAYPELACFPERVDAGAAADDWGIFYDVFCIGNDKTVKFLEDVMDYVCELFPSQVIHIGGDECPTANWAECPKCQARMKAAGLTKPAELQMWITRHMAEYLAKKGRRVMGWDEILNGDVPKTAIGQSWRVAAKEGAGTDLVSGAQGALKGHDMVISPHTLTYYSADQALDEDPFRRAPKKGGLSLEKAYTAFDPMAGMPEEVRGKVLGGQCCMWGEYLWNGYDLEWKMWPRGFAMAEILWSAPAKRDFAEFERRVAAERKRLISMGVNCAPLR